MPACQITDSLRAYPRALLALASLTIANGTGAAWAAGNRPASEPVDARPNAAASDGDLAVYGSGDVTGYHLFTASASGAWAWRALATLQPGGYEDERWIGQQCLTGDGRTVVAVVAPWSANNSEAGMNAGAFAYAVDTGTGAVRPLAAGVSLAYFDPGCGVDGTVALTSYLGLAQRPTRVSVMDTATGRTLQSSTTEGEYTSAVSFGGRVLAAQGSALVDVTSGAGHVVHRFDGQLANLHPASDGGVDLTSQPTADSTQVWHVAPNAATRLVAAGGAASLTLMAGAHGHNVVANAATLAPNSGLTAVTLPAGLTPQAASSQAGLIQVADTAAPTNVAHTGNTEVATWRPGASAVSRSPLPKPSRRRTLAMPSVTLSTSTSVPFAQAGTTGPGIATGAAAMQTSTPETSIPQCSVPRNDIYKQVWQPGADQIRWAINQAALSALQPPDNSIARPTANQNYTLNDASYNPLPQLYPSKAFPLQNLAPGSNPAVTVPPLVMYGILAQESNWSQASWHAIPGRSGNPLVADYYGVNNPKNPAGALDYSYADCGYGVSQVTTGMQNAAYPGAQSPLPPNTQVALAVDYATNIAYAEQVLQSKWQQLAALGVTMNNADPTKVENWYAAIWGYNSGVYTGGPGDRGLGWFNNPANPIYPAVRHTFLHNGLTPTPIDAANPQNWPYQEKVFGWMEVPFANNGVLYYRGTYDWDTKKGTFLKTPSLLYFCSTTVNNCNQNNIGTGADPCPAENSSCWWDAPVKWVSDDCAASCITDTPWNAPNNHIYYDVPGLPEPVDAPLSATCALGANTPVTNASGGLLPGTILVDDEMIPSQNPSKHTPNLMGCSATNSALVPPVSANASFSLLAPDDTATDAAASPGESSAIDLHQLGAGIGGHLFFTHTGSDQTTEARAQWQATLPANTTTGSAYQVYAFVPDIAATAGYATYEVSESNCFTYPCPGYQEPVYDGQGNPVAIRTINQGNYTDQWVSLGYYLCGGPGGKSTCTLDVTTRSVTPSSDQTQGSDIAFNAVAFVPAQTDAYVAIGDSYSSGEGVAGSDGSLATYDDGTDVTDNTPGDSVSGHGDLCHRSDLAWPALLAKAKGLPFINLACSGSDLGDIDGQEYWMNQSSSAATFLGITLPGLYETKYHTDNAVPTPGTLVSGASQPTSSPGDNWFTDLPNNEAAGSAFFGESSYQLDLLRALRPRMVTLTIGGNDVGFADIINTCLSYSVPELNEGCMNDLWSGTSDGVYNRIQSLEPMLATAYQQIAAAVGSTNKVTVVTYPAPVTYNSSDAPGSWDCTNLYSEDRGWLVPEVASLASVIQQAGGHAGVHVIDIHTLFNNNGPCASTPYVTAPDIAGAVIHQYGSSQIDNWFHPDKAGYAAMEQAIAAQIAVPAP